MEITDEWGRKTCISSPVGPYFSNPSDSELLFSSPSLSPPILSTVPHLTPARFLSVSGVPPSDSSAIVSASFNIPSPHDDTARVLSYNRLQFLPFPTKNSVLVFFPTGTNLDRIGFLLLSVGDSGGLQVMGSNGGDVFVATERLFSRILKILVQPVSVFVADKCTSSNELGYVLVYSLYSIHWFSVKYDESQGKPVLRNLGCKQFKRCMIVSASWSPHLTGECLVLLENGEVFLFDLNQSHCRLRGSKLKVSWEGHGRSAAVNRRNWLGCDFGWTFGIYLVARSDVVFAITRSSEDCSVRCLLQVESMNMAGTEEFVGFAKAGSDSFRFILASQSYVFLCDPRSGVPLLKWQHDVERPCFIDAYRLSELGLGTVESTTSCVIIGSFWNAQSQMFCYGPSPSVVKDPCSLYVWELPHNLLLPAGKCLCGDCVFREGMMKESLLEWIDWQKKSVLVLGFGVLNKYLPLESSDQSSGFTLIRLTSSGKLEAVKFCASALKSLEVAHKDSACKPDEVNLLYLPDEDEYKLPRRFKYLDLKYLSAHTKGKLAGFIDSKMKTKSSGLQKNKSFSLNCHEELCKKLKICGFGRDRSSSSVTAVFENISSPTSVFDIALRETWSSLPIEILLLAFSNYSEFEDVLVDKKKPSLEFLAVPEFPQLPPFLVRKPSRRSSKWSKKEQPSVELVGPVLPLPVLTTLHEFRNGCLNSEQEFSPEAEFSNRCNQISKVTRELANSGQEDETTISLGDDRDDDMWLNSDSQKEKKAFISYRPITKTTDSDRQQKELTTFVSRVRRCKEADIDDGGTTGLELFDNLSPVEICFENRKVNFDTKALLTSKTLLSQWQQRSSSYQEFLSQYHLQK
ncbi:PREDICTED: uncharacterized protein LOC104765691 [Camelina sativa]|uniref:Uncharacterized protein LOC104765691 n=1 Tax=Camelina sativa TaxID=90675 RepID=A0ABM0XLL2_CAMSA|nr:PREDICTED: uncharacterized protein LOC104765691 [Camelina sativa]